MNGWVDKWVGGLMDWWMARRDDEKALDSFLSESINTTQSNLNLPIH
jgi:hypothetical protein